MVASQRSRRAVFRTVAQTSYHEWPVYDSTPLYDRSSLSGLNEDIRIVATTWFDHEAHETVEAFVTHYPLAYVDFCPHDRYTGSTRYEMTSLFRMFLLKELFGWSHESALVEYLQRLPSIRQDLGLDTDPDQSTLWRSWHHRFSADLRETVTTAARTILIKAAENGVSVPREPDQKLARSEEAPESTVDDRTILDRAEEITDQISGIAYPAFSLDRGEGCEIHEHAFWDLQTYLGLREKLAVNEGARSFIHESQRDRTPLGHAHREHIRGLTVDAIRELYRHAVKRLIDRWPRRTSSTGQASSPLIRPKKTRSPAIEPVTRRK
jgi:hypothetical protein